MNTSEVLNKAADSVERLGWKTGPTAMAVGGPVCAMGAIGVAIDSSSEGGFFNYDPIESHPAYKALMYYLGIDSPVYTWNDEQDDASSVIEALRAAALIEAAKESAAVQVPAEVVA